MFRFTIRELVLLTLVVAMGVGWWVDRSQLVIEHRNRASAQSLKARDQYGYILDLQNRIAELSTELRTGQPSDQTVSPLP